MRTVKDILETKDAPSNFITRETMVIDALKELISVNLSYLIVRENDEYKGIFSERDYTRKLVIEGRSSRETKVGEVMTTNLPEVNLESTVEDCMYKMNMRGARYVAVFDGDEFKGIITIHDLLRQILANKNEVFSDALTNQLLNTDESAKIF